jgi:hypothetical protein
MTVQFFIGRSPEGQPLSPEYSHEMLAIIDLCKGLWNAFHAHQPYYAVVANLNDPSLDFMIVSERGIGVMELKHYFGQISCRDDGSWYAGPKRMVAGVEGRGFKNPHEQVQAYAEQIRAKLISPPPWQRPWLPGKTIDWENFKFHTAVCFTHPEADLAGFGDNLRLRCRPIILPWEHFSVLNPPDVPGWVASLRFEVGGDRSQNFTRHRFHFQDISRILTELLGLTTWEEIYDLMPTGQAYAVLSRMENYNPVQDFSLEEDEVIIGRDLQGSDVPVPDKYYLVSRQHARILRQADGLYIEDMGSTNGTFVDGQPVDRRTPLLHGQQITLGSAEISAGVCHFEISLQVENLDNREATQKLGNVGRPRSIRD